MNILEAEGLKKQFGSHKVLEDVSMYVPEHCIYGFLGKNGAGKTTTMKMILGLLKPDEGSIRVMQETVEYGETKTNRYIGYLPDVPEFYSYMNAEEYLQFCGRISGMSGGQLKKKIKELLEMTGLAGVKKRTGQFSRGMKQRLGIAQALLNDPKLLICDEPTSALDPVGRKEILDIMAAVRERTTVIFSTHVLSDVERICDRIAILNEGKIIIEGELEQVRETHGTRGLLAEFLEEENLVRFLKKAGLEKNKAEITERQITIYEEHPEREIMRWMEVMQEEEICPIRLEMIQPSLEKVFMEAIQ